MATLPYSQETGPVYTLINADGSTAVFNDPTHASYVAPLTEVTGLDSPEVQEASVEKVEEDGGLHGTFFYARRPFTLTGLVTPSSALDRNTRLDRLTRATNAMRSDATLMWIPSGHTDPVQLTSIRRQQALRTSGKWSKEFLFGGVAAEPRILGPQRMTQIWSGDAGYVRHTAAASASQAPHFYNGVALPAAGRYRFEAWVRGTYNGGTVSVNAESYTGVTSHTQTTQVLDPTTWRKVSVEFSVVAGDVSGQMVFRTSSVATVGQTLEMIYPTIVAVNVPTNPNSAGAGLGTVQTGANWTASLQTADVQTEENQGNTPSTPEKVIITGPLTNPGVFLWPSGVSYTPFYKSIRTSGLTLAGGQSMTINFRNRTILRNDGTNLYQYVTFAESTWWDIPAGTPVKFVLEGTSPTALTTRGEVYWRSAWM